MTSKPSRDFYAILGVSKNSSEAEIQSSFRKLAFQHHPDRHRDDESRCKAAEEKFKEISEAYDILKDKRKREIYDRYGEEGLRGGFSGGGSGGFDIFRHFFGGMGSEQDTSSGPRKGKDVVRALKVSLEDLYNGAEKSIKIQRLRNCKVCKGTGSSNAEVGVVKCKTCEGRGVRIQTRRMGPGFVQQFQTSCSDCQGQGKTIDPKYVCEKCGGKKVYEEQKTLTVFIDKGMRENQKITFEGEADEQPDIFAGDIVFVLQQKPHELFERNNSDLFMKKTIPLTAALGGVCFEVPHMDGRKLLVKTAHGEIIHPGQTKMIKGEGFPTYRDPFNRGNLYIKFEIEFPAMLQEKDIVNLKQLLSPLFPNNNSSNMDMINDGRSGIGTNKKQRQQEVLCYLKPIDLNTFQKQRQQKQQQRSRMMGNSNNGSNSMMMEEDDDEEMEDATATGFTS